MAYCQQLYPFVQVLLGDSHVQRAVLVQGNDAQLGVLLAGDFLPGDYVGVVLQLGNDNCITLT